MAVQEWPDILAHTPHVPQQQLQKATAAGMPPLANVLSWSDCILFVADPGVHLQVRKAGGEEGLQRTLHQWQSGVPSLVDDCGSKMIAVISTISSGYIRCHLLLVQPCRPGGLQRQFPRQCTESLWWPQAAPLIERKWQVAWQRRTWLSQRRQQRRTSSWHWLCKDTSWNRRQQWWMQSHQQHHLGMNYSLWFPQWKKGTIKAHWSCRLRWRSQCWHPYCWQGMAVLEIAC